jgi:hypothetical protein
MGASQLETRIIAPATCVEIKCSIWKSLVGLCLVGLTSIAYWINPSWLELSSVGVWSFRIVLGLCTAYALLQLCDRRPVLLLDHSGLCDRRMRWVELPWSQLISVKAVPIPNPVGWGPAYASIMNVEFEFDRPIAIPSIDWLWRWSVSSKSKIVIDIRGLDVGVVRFLDHVRHFAPAAKVEPFNPIRKFL